MQDIIKFFEALEIGSKRVINNDYVLNEEVQKEIKEVFSILFASKTEVGIFEWKDKIPIRTNISNFRAVPGATIRRGSFIGENAVILPSFINIGSHIGKGTMIDSYATIGSCAYIGENCHISSGTVIAGVLEPIGKMPVIIENDVFIGAQCVISEGMRVKSGAVISAGVILTSSTKIFDINTKEQFDHVPNNAVVVPGSYEKNGFSIQCAIIAKYKDNGTQNKTKINENLRK